MWQICKLMSKLLDCSIERNEVPPLVSRRQVGVELRAQSQFNGSNPVISHRPNWAADPACLNIQYCTLSAPRSNKQRYGTIAIRNIHETAAMEMILLFEKFTAFSRPIVPKIMTTKCIHGKQIFSSVSYQVTDRKGRRWGQKGFNYKFFDHK